MLMPVVQFQGGAKVFRNDALVAAVLRHAERHAIGKPCQLVGDFLALERGHVQGEREAVFELAYNDALKPPDLVEIGDHAASDLAGKDAGQCHTAG